MAGQFLKESSRIMRADLPGQIDGNGGLLNDDSDVAWDNLSCGYFR